MAQNKEQEKALFDSLAQRGQYYYYTKKGYERILNKFFLRCRPKSSEIILEIGCGTGVYTRKMYERHKNIVAIDISEISIQVARQACPDVGFIIGDIEHIGFKQASVDICVCFGVLHHFPQLADTLSEIYCVLKPGGRVFSLDPYKYNPAFWLYRDPLSPLFSKVDRTDNEYLMKRRFLHRSLSVAGFTDIKIEVLAGVPNCKASTLLEKCLLPLYNTFDSVLDKTRIGRWIGPFVIGTAKKNEVETQ